jgi:hypothetical protein
MAIAPVDAVVEGLLQLLTAGVHLGSHGRRPRRPAFWGAPAGRSESELARHASFGKAMSRLFRCLNR